jgi:hypothetical protein
VLAVVLAGAAAQRVLGPRVSIVLRLLMTHPSLVLMDGSIASRYVQIAGGAYTALANPLGTGRSVGDPEVFDAASRALGFRRHVPPGSMSYILGNRTAEGNIAVLSPVGDSLARMGLAFVALTGFLLALLRCPAASAGSRVFFAFGIVSSFPLSFPPYWLLLGMHAGWARLQQAGGRSSSSLAG